MFKGSGGENIIYSDYYYLLMGSLSMDGAYYLWMVGLLVVENLSTRRMAGHHGRASRTWKSLPSMDGRIHEWDATYALFSP